MLEYFALPSSSCWTSSCAVDAERLGAAIDVEPVAGLVLHLGDQRHLAAQVRRARDPVALRQHADDLGVRVLRHHPRELLAVALRHPVLRLDALAARDARLELRHAGSVLGWRTGRTCCGARLLVHSSTPEPTSVAHTARQGRRPLQCRNLVPGTTSAGRFSGSALHGSPRSGGNAFSSAGRLAGRAVVFSRTPQRAQGGQSDALADGLVAGDYLRVGGGVISPFGAQGSLRDWTRGQYRELAWETWQEGSSGVGWWDSGSAPTTAACR